VSTASSRSDPDIIRKSDDQLVIGYRRELNSLAGNESRMQDEPVVLEVDVASGRSGRFASIAAGRKAEKAQRRV
jgi:hypothetical protein